MKTSKEIIQLIVDVEITYDTGSKGGKRCAINTAKEVIDSNLEVTGFNMKHGGYMIRSKKVALFERGKG